MAVRPLVTTGVALLSAGALVAGTPALFVPRDEITVAASTAEATVHRTMTAEQINLVALSLEGALGSFLDGYGGYYYQGYVPAPTPGYILNEDGTKLLEPDEDTPANTALVGPDGKPLYRLDADGQATIPATVGDMGAGVQFYDRAGNKVNENFYDPGNCSATGAMCHDGFTGLAYYLSDNILPLDVFDNIFFEAVPPNSPISVRWSQPPSSMHSTRPNVSNCPSASMNSSPAEPPWSSAAFSMTIFRTAVSYRI